MYTPISVQNRVCGLDHLVSLVRGHSFWVLSFCEDPGSFVCLEDPIPDRIAFHAGEVHYDGIPGSTGGYPHHEA